MLSARLFPEAILERCGAQQLGLSIPSPSCMDSLPRVDKTSIRNLLARHGGFSGSLLASENFLWRIVSRVSLAGVPKP